jgi:formate/nitrite transporter
MAMKSSLEIARTVCSAAQKKSDMPVFTAAVSAFMAGAYIAFGGSSMIFATQELASFIGIGLSKYIGGIIFSMGIFMIVAAGGELFTGNCLMAMGAFRGTVPARKLIRSWVSVYIMNFAGAFVMALLVKYSGAMTGVAEDALFGIVDAKTRLMPFEMVIRGVLCNWLVCAAVWMSYGAEGAGGKFICCALPVAAFVALGYEHSVANMYFFSHALLLDGGCPLPACAANMFFVTAGNIAGGALFMALPYYLIYREELAQNA